MQRLKDLCIYSKGFLRLNCRLLQKLLNKKLFTKFKKSFLIREIWKNAYNKFEK